MPFPPASEYVAALRLWWSFAWRTFVAMLAATLILAIVGVTWIKLGLSGRTWTLLVNIVSLPLFVFVQVEALRRIIRLYGFKLGASSDG